MRGLVVDQGRRSRHVWADANATVFLGVGVLEKLQRLATKEGATQLSYGVMPLGTDNAAGPVDQEIIKVNRAFLNDFDSVHRLVKRIKGGS